MTWKQFISLRHGDKILMCGKVRTVFGNVKDGSKIVAFWKIKSSWTDPDPAAYYDWYIPQVQRAKLIMKGTP